MLTIVNEVCFSTLQGGTHGWSVPLLAMACSGPLWAIIISQMCSNWYYYTLLTSLPTYMDTVLHFDLRQVRRPKSFNPLTAVFRALSINE